MAWLDASLAFAVTMLIFSAMASMAAEMIHRLFRLRERGLRQMLGQLFETVLWPRFEPAIRAAGLTDDLSICREQFVNLVSQSRSVEPGTLFGSLLNGRQLTALSAPQFMERLGSSRLGPELLRELQRLGEAAVDVALKDVAQKFEAYSREISTFFARRARLFSVAVALVLAFGLNIDAIRLFRTYLDNDALRTAMVQRADEAKQLYERQLQHLNAAQLAGGADPASEDVLAAVENGTTEIRAAMVDLSGSGVPIGWSYYPGRWSERGLGAGDSEGPVRFVGWLLSTVLAGLLIGLGGPFWYDAICALSTVTSLARGVLRRPAADAAADPRESAQPATPVEVFRTAAEAASLSPTPPDLVVVGGRAE